MIATFVDAHAQKWYYYAVVLANFMSAPEKKPEAQAEAPKAPENLGIFDRITNWVRNQVSKVISWFRPKKETHQTVSAKTTTATEAGAEKTDAHDTGQKTHEAHEAHEELVDKLDLAVKGRCASPGNYVGLSEKQRKNLGVQEKDLVELFDHAGKSLGVFVVGKIDKDVLKSAGEKEKATVCTANVPKGVEKIVVKKTEKKIETVEEMSVKVLDKCKTEGAYIGLSEFTRMRLGVKVGDTVVVISDGDKKEFYTVGEITEESFQKANDNADVVTLNNPNLIGKTVRVLKKIDKLNTKLDVTLDAAKNSPPKRAQKIQERFGADNEVNADTYITVPNPIAHELGCLYADVGKSNVTKISKVKVKIGDKNPVPMIVVPRGQKVGFTKEAAKVLSIKDKVKKLKVEAKDGLLHLDVAA